MVGFLTVTGNENCVVFTVEEMMPHVQHLNGAVTKNLFLKDKKKKSLWLVSVRHDRQVNLNDLAKKLGVGSGNLRFADEAAMLEKLKVGQGCATALALFCDKDQSIKFVLDNDLTTGGHERVYFHPMTNAATMGIKPDDLMRFLKETGHEPILYSFE
ncbi:prolyl-tRNA synthetase associated domain-containing protein 1 [Trichomycterus rosablanca]|uniref:prolyl-tRNA synthetase associated domain-containing protein 1 n=1 Tax=Trichomycterus rosablanca TaxID=2290929 RepID=UPI002F358CB5